MKYEQRIVAFIDFLGFKNVIGATEHSEEALQNLIHALKYTRHHFRPVDPDGEFNFKESNVTHFSDSIVISFSMTNESGVFFALIDIQHLLMNLAAKGFVCRGGIAAGKMIHTGDMVFGPAFVEAYELESKIADVPRVLVPENVIELGATFHADHHDFDMEHRYINQIVSMDDDGNYYVDYFEKCLSELDDPELDAIRYFEALKVVIEGGLQSSEEKVKAKYKWMAKKHNRMAEHIHGAAPVFAQ